MSEPAIEIAAFQPAAPFVSRGIPISIRRLTKRYGAFHALDAVDLDVRCGEFLTLLGPSGSGKSTLLMAIAGFARPSSGSILFDGTEITRAPPHKRDIGIVFQNYALFPHMNVGANIAYPLRLRRVAKAEIDRRVKQALELVRLGGMEERTVDSLSGGQRQRVALARAVVFEPKVLLMDEPLSALDKKLREHMQIEIRHLHEKLDITTIYVTHDQREALTMSDRIAVLNHGRVAQVAGPQELYEQPDSLFVADFIGEAAIVPVEARGGDLTCVGRPLRTDRPVASGERPLYLVLRPEKLDLCRSGDLANWNCFSGILADVVYQGESVILTVRLDSDATVQVRKPSDRETLNTLPQAGRRVWVGVHVQDTLVVPGDEP